MGAERARVRAILRRRPRGCDRGGRGERAGRRAAGRRHHARRRRRARLGPRQHRCSRRARSSARGRSCTRSGATTCRTRSPSRSASTGRSSRSSSSRSDTRKPPTPSCGAPRSTPRCSACACRERSLSVRARPSCSPATSRSPRPGSRGSPRRWPPPAGARLPAAFSLALAGRALAAAGERAEAIAVLRKAESELDACGSVRVRDEMRRELRRLGARAEPPARSRLPRRGLADLLPRAAGAAGRGAAGGAGQGARRSRSRRRPRGPGRVAAGTRRRAVRRARRAGRPPVRGPRVRRLARR